MNGSRREVSSGATRHAVLGAGLDGAPLATNTHSAHYTMLLTCTVTMQHRASLNDVNA